MKISELIQELLIFRNDHGDVQVITARDTEGNGFLSLEKQRCLGAVTNYSDDKVMGCCLWGMVEGDDDVEVIREQTARERR